MMVSARKKGKVGVRKKPEEEIGTKKRALEWNVLVLKLWNLFKSPLRLKKSNMKHFLPLKELHRSVLIEEKNSSSVFLSHLGHFNLSWTLYIFLILSIIYSSMHIQPFMQIHFFHMN
jgi:hypothetical protein